MDNEEVREDMSEKERDLERAIENRTEDPEELLDPEDIDFYEDLKKCPECGTEFEKVDEHTWKPNCDCYEKPIRVCIG